MKVLLVLLVGVSSLLVPQAPDGLRVIVIDGDEAANIVAERIAAQPVVEVRDREDRQVAGAVVRFYIRRTVRNRLAALFSNGQSEATTLTDVAGRAQASSITPLEPGSYQIDVQVSHQGRNATATIRHTNYPTRADVQNAGQTSAVSSAGAAAPSVAAAGGGLSKLAVIGIVAGGAAGGGAAAFLARKESAAPARITSVVPSAIFGIQAGTAFTFSVQVADFDSGSLSYLWEFGDGGVSNEPAPTHVYQAAGSFPVAVTVSDAGQSVRSELSVTVVGMSGTWQNPIAGGTVLQLSQSGTTITGIESNATYSNCVVTGSVQHGTPAVILNVPPCPHPIFAPHGGHEYRLDVSPDGRSLSGTWIYDNGTQFGIVLQR
jgi:PKD repeat protein